MSEHQSILSGVRVLEIATFVFGPGATVIMADFGADVIKIEAPGIGDPYRYVHKSPPFVAHDFAYFWQQDNRNKRSVALDMKHPEGREILMQLVRQADVLVTNFPPNVLARLKIRYEDLKPENEKLIYAQITGYGESGPDANKPGYDATAYWARTGLMDMVRTAESDPAMSTPAMGDNPSAMTMFAGVMTALYQRERTGRGSKVSSSLMANGVWAASGPRCGLLAGAPPMERSSCRTARHARLSSRTRCPRTSPRASTGAILRARPPRPVARCVSGAWARPPTRRAWTCGSTPRPTSAAAAWSTSRLAPPTGPS